MNLVFIGPFGFHPNKTMRSRAFPLARFFVQAGHSVKMLMPPWHTPAEAGRQWEEDGVAVEYVSLQGGVRGITQRLMGQALATRPEVIHTFKPKAYAGLAMWGLWYSQWARSHRPLLCTDTDDWEGWGGWNSRANYSPPQKQFFAWQEQWGLTHHQGLTVASRALETLAWGQGVEPSQVLYVPNGSGLPAVPPLTPAEREAKRRELGLENRPVLLLYSRLFEFDVPHLVNILAQVKQAVPHLAILSIGAGLFAEDSAHLRQAWQEANLLEQVVELGWLAENELPGWLDTADVGLYLMKDDLLNRTKCPVKLADLVARGVPVVGERVGQVSEYVVAGQTGFLRPAGDTAGVVQDVVTLLTRPELRQSFSIQAQTHYQTYFDWSAAGQRLLNYYQQRLKEG